jgi:uncharacterized repeat protein (TIGR03803 family)
MLGSNPPVTAGAFRPRMEDDLRASRSARFVLRSLGVFAVVAMVGNAAVAAGTTKVIFSFEEESGEYPYTELVRDGAGNLYGTAVEGGEFGGGTVFQLTPSGNLTVLYNFTGQQDGGQPYGGVTLDAQGNLYGTAVVGGSGRACEEGCGVAYKLANEGGVWTQTVLHNFTGGNDGAGPGAGLTIDQRGNLYGMTPIGGSYGLGTIYQLHPTQQGEWRFRLVHTFTGGLDGSSGSAGRMIFDQAGRLVGATTVGGAYGHGIVFRLRHRAGSWKLKTLHSFRGQPDAGFPYGSLLIDRAGRLYGTTYYDGANDLGAVYQLTQGPDGLWRERVLHSFQGGISGSNSVSNLVLESRSLYGTTSQGGAPGCSCGTIFELTPDGQGTWTHRVAHAFTGAPDGAYAYSGMVADGQGNLYGATAFGGEADDGAIYRFTP